LNSRGKRSCALRRVVLQCANELFLGKEPVRRSKEGKSVRKSIRSTVRPEKTLGALGEERTEEAYSHKREVKKKQYDKTRRKGGKKLELNNFIHTNANSRREEKTRN